MSYQVQDAKNVFKLIDLFYNISNARKTARTHFWAHQNATWWIYHKLHVFFKFCRRLLDDNDTV